MSFAYDWHVIYDENFLTPHLWLRGMHYRNYASQGVDLLLMGNAMDTVLYSFHIFPRASLSEKFQGRAARLTESKLRYYGNNPRHREITTSGFRNTAQNASKKPT